MIRASSVALGIALALAPATALAQTQPAEQASAQPGGNDGLMDIVVTAQRVSENLQKVPVAVTTFDSEQLKQSSIETIADIAVRTPGFTAGQSNPVEPNFALRGIGSPQGISQNAAGDPSVVVFIDGIYAGRGGTPDLDALDLERVEVLRGPQGTLFGKNAIGGLINFVLRKPGPETRVHAEMTVGNFKRLDGLARANVALSDTVFASGSFAVKNRDGFYLNEPTGNRNPNLSLSSGRGAIRFYPNESLDLTVSVDLVRQDQRAQPRDKECDITFNSGLHCVGNNPDPRITSSTIDGFIKRDLNIYRAELAMETPLGEVTSLTAFRTAKLRMYTPFFSGPIDPPLLIESIQSDRENDKQFSEELRLAIGNPGDALRGQIGAYYLKEQIRRYQTITQYFPLPSQSGIVGYPQAIDARSVALFGQFNYNLLSNLTLTAGARMTWEKKWGTLGGTVVAGPAIPIPLTSPYDVDVSKSWDAFTPRGGIEWQVTDLIMAYASVSRGYKSGGYQGIAPTGASAAVPYNPEFAWSYEIGVKSRFADNRIQLNVSAFQTDHKDLQVAQLTATNGIVVGNAAESKLKGIEAEMVARDVTPGFHPAATRDRPLLSRMSAGEATGWVDP
ncbi:iron complex outermembrane receptor protein, partial [Hephaestia caeni]